MIKNKKNETLVLVVTEYVPDHIGRRSTAWDVLGPGLCVLITARSPSRSLGFEIPIPEKNNLSSFDPNPRGWL